jgi:hypothetical protein
VYGNDGWRTWDPLPVQCAERCAIHIEVEEFWPVRHDLTRLDGNGPNSSEA